MPEGSLAQLQGLQKARYVSAMFARIAHRYDLLNTLMTAGMHHRWRRAAARLALEGLQGTALDVATGTGDLAFALARRREAQQVVALDFVPDMLSLARAKARRSDPQAKVRLVTGDALTLPFPEGSFVCATSGFSMRNVADLEEAAREMARVTRPGGRVVILEITPMRRRGLFPALFRWYFRHVTPRLGQLFAGDREAYTYLPASVEVFPTAQELAALMERAGLHRVEYQLVGLGTVAIHVGVKPPAMEGP